MLTGSALGRACPGWHLGELRAIWGREEADAGHGAGQERELGQQTRPYCAAPGPPARPSIAALCSMAAPPAFPAAAALREHRGRRSEVAVVLGGQGERRRVGRAGCRDPSATAWLGAAGCCGSRMLCSLMPPALGARCPGRGASRFGRHLGNPVPTPLPLPSHQALPVLKVAVAAPRCWVLPRGRDEQVGSEGLTSAPGVDADEGSHMLPSETRPS